MVKEDTICYRCSKTSGFLGMLKSSTLEICGRKRERCLRLTTSMKAIISSSGDKQPRQFWKRLPVLHILLLLCACQHNTWHCTKKEASPLSSSAVWFMPNRIKKLYFQMRTDACLHLKKFHKDTASTVRDVQLTTGRLFFTVNQKLCKTLLFISFSNECDFILFKIKSSESQGECEGSNWLNLRVQQQLPESSNSHTSYCLNMLPAFNT